MKIAYIIPSLKQKGPIIVVKEIVENLIKLGIDKENIVIFYFDNSNDIDFPVQTIKINFLSSLKDYNIDIYHSHMLRPDLFLFKEKIVNKLIINQKKIYYVTTLHQKNYDQFVYEGNNKIISAIISIIWELIISAFDKIIVFSPSMKSYYKTKILRSSKKLDIIANGRTIEKCIYKDIKEKDKIYLGTSCNLNKRKNIDKVLLSIKNIENVEYYIIGDGPEKSSLLNTAKELGIYNRVHFLGYKSNALEYYKLFDIFILLSESEGMSLSLIEAAALKKTIICSKIEPNLDMFTEKEVIFVNQHNIQEVEDAIRNAPKYNLGESAYMRYINNYTGICMAGKYLELYKKLLNKANSQRKNS
jgi:glycosyltransferase involved in cell wall biosynthesis